MNGLNTITNALAKLLPSLKKSDGSIEAKIIDVVGTYADSESIERQNSINIINTALANQSITTKEYYRNKAVSFQINDALSYDPINQSAFYEVIDPKKQIVKQAYIVGDYPMFFLLINAVDDSGHLRVLTSSELASFKTFFDAFQPLGLKININSLKVANITDPNIVIWVQAGSDASDVSNQINDNLLKYESTYRKNNTVSLSEIEDVIKQSPSVIAVGWDNPTSTEQQLDGTYKTTYVSKGVFNIENGAFTFGTVIDTNMIKVLE